MMEQLAHEAKTKGLKELIKKMLALMPHDEKKETLGGMDEQEEHGLTSAEGEEIAEEHREQDPNFYTKEDVLHDGEGEQEELSPEMEMEMEKKKFMRNQAKASPKKGMTIMMASSKKVPFSNFKKGK